MKRPGAPVLLAALFLLAGCDNFYGLTSEKTLTAPPDMDCIASALASVGGVEILEHRQRSSDSGRRQPDPGPVHTISDSWAYRFDTSRRATLQIIQNNQNNFKYINGLIQINAPVDEDYIQALEMIVPRVDAAIARDCDVDLSGPNIWRR